jgi:hypothetical protein
MDIVIRAIEIQSEIVIINDENFDLLREDNASLR